MIDYSDTRQAIEAHGDMVVQWFVSAFPEPEIPNWVVVANRVDQFTAVAAKDGRMLLRGISSAYAAILVCALLDVVYKKEPHILMCLNQDGTDYGTTRVNVGAPGEPVYEAQGTPIIPRLHEEYLTFFEPYQAEVDGEIVMMSTPQQSGEGWELPA